MPIQPLWTATLRVRLPLLLLLFVLLALLAVFGTGPAQAAVRATPAPTRVPPLRSTPTRTSQAPRAPAGRVPSPPATATPPSSAVTAAALTAAGRQVYLKNYCGVCHTLAAASTRGTFGPPHDHIGAVAAQRAVDPHYGGEAKTAAAYLRESILTPAVYATPGYANTSHPMPAYAHLPPGDVDALIYFLLQQK